jgi:LmbE family N-acetylglucosaminyl deacetylase
VPQNTLLLAAHCDDIAFGLSGLTKLLHLGGSKLTSIILTNQGEIRKKEETAANEILGISQTYFLDFEDGKLTNSQFEIAKKTILAILDKKQFDNIVSFDNFGYTGHLDHIFVSLLAGSIFEQTDSVKYLSYQSMTDEERMLWMPYFVHIPSQAFFEAKSLNIEPVINDKILAIQIHESQFACDGQAHIERILTNKPEEKYRILTK